MPRARAPAGLLLLLALSSASRLPAQAAVHRLRREAGLVHEALATLERAMRKSAADAEERSVALDALETALRDGADWLVPVEIGTLDGDHSCRLRVPIQRLATRMACTLPPWLADDWQARSRARAQELSSRPAELLRGFPDSPQAGRARILRAHRLIEAGMPARAAFQLLSYLEAFLHRPEAAPVPWSQTAALLQMAAVPLRDLGLQGRAKRAGIEAMQLGEEEGEISRLLDRISRELAPRSEAPASRLVDAWEVMLRGQAPRTDPAAVPLPTCVSRNRVVVANGNALTALEVATGARAWQVRPAREGEAIASLAAGEGVVVIATRSRSGARLLGRRIEDGSEAWTLRLPVAALAFGPAAVEEGRCVVEARLPGEPGAAGRWVLGLEARSGHLLWRTLVDAAPEETDRPQRAETIGAPPLLHRGLVILASRRGEIAALCLEDGAPRWTLEHPTEAERQPEARRSPRLVARNGRLAARPWFTNRDLRMPCDLPLPATASLQRLRIHWGEAPPGTRLLDPGSGPALYCRGRGRDRPSQVWQLQDRPPDARPPVAPLSGPALSAAAIPSGVFVSTGRYIYRLDPGTGEPGSPVLSRESERPGPWLRLLPARGALIGITPVSVARLQPAR